MSSVFIAFCFVKTISGNDKFITGNALYRINDDEDEYREITFKGFTRGISYLNCSDFSQSDSLCTLEDLPYAFPLLIYLAPAVINSYKSNNDMGRQSFMLSKKLYNAVTSQKGIDSDVIVSYANANSHYDLLRDSLKKTILSSYASNEPQLSNSSLNGKSKLHKEFNNQLDVIEEQYFKKRRRPGPFASASTSSNANTLPVNLMNLTDQIRENRPASDQSSSDHPTFNQPSSHPSISLSPHLIYLLLVAPLKI
ncbi:hypothetical protein F8M41_024102 [Gigaspora margarita]|uniref:Uncharacterized protein n=1 Tax=Gigaspora margarita TaxID=4874 RepID=A0A8H4ACA2_GIGMA|nr:hypothetical protein F8M41_024102 [Gigaspora margarita]